MIFGRIKVVGHHVETHNDDYALHQISVVSVRRPFLLGSLTVGSALTAFGLAFADVLYLNELLTITALVASLVFVGLWLGNLQFLSRDLRNSQLGTVIWGSYRVLNQKRRVIARAIGRGESGAGQ